MKDVQSQQDFRCIDIQKVGVKEISYPITVLDKAHRVQKTVARVNMYVSLPHRFKGTHMSRFVEILNRFHGNINLKSIHLILEEMKSRLQAEAAHVEIEFPYFLKKKNNGGSVNTAEYRCRMHGSLGAGDDLILEIQVPIPSLSLAPRAAGLPRSLGRWGVADVSLRFRHFIWIEDVIESVEQVTSWPENAAACVEDLPTVEGLTRAIAGKLARHPEILWLLVAVENLSAGHSTYAAIEWPEPTSRDRAPALSS